MGHGVSLASRSCHYGLESIPAGVEVASYASALQARSFEHLYVHVYFRICFFLQLLKQCAIPIQRFKIGIAGSAVLVPVPKSVHIIV